MLSTLHEEIAANAIDKWFGYYIGQSNIPGAQLCVIRHGKTVLNKAYGVANLLTQELMRTDHLCALSSQSKMVTSAALLLLQEQNKLSLRDPAAIYLQELADHPDPRARQITLRDLLTHRSGLEREGPFAAYWEGEIPPPSRSDVRCGIGKTKIICDPNTVTKYSNFGFALLGAVIESIEDGFYQTVIDQFINPYLKGEKLYADCPAAPKDKLSAGHSLPYKNGERVPFKAVPANGLAPACGCYASAAAMARFTHEFLRGTDIVSTASQREILNLFWHYDKSPNNEYGLGVERTQLNDRVYIGHNGAHFGHQTQTRFLAEQDMVVSVALNARDPMLVLIDSCAEVFDVVEKQFAQEPPSNIVVSKPLLGIESAKLYILGPTKAVEFSINRKDLGVEKHILKKSPEGYVDTDRKGTDFVGEAVSFAKDEQGRIVQATLGGQVLVPKEAYEQRRSKLQLHHGAPIL